MALMSKTISLFLYLKYCANRAMSHLGAVKAIIEIGLLFAIWLKIQDYSLFTIVMLCGVTLLIIVGHVDVNLGIAEKENSLSNKYNPEIQRILRKKYK